MTLSGVKDFFRASLNPLKLKEWVDVFNIENIPATILDGSYHLDVGNIQISTVGVQAQAFNFVHPITLKVLSKGFRNPSAAVDAGLDKAQAILESVLNAAIDSKGIKSVTARAINNQPFSLSNDHAVIITMTFTVEMILTF